MFDRDSRYANRPLKQMQDAQGRTVTFVSRRLIAQRTPVAEVAVQPGDRLDLIADRAYGDARMGWRIKEANPETALETLPDVPLPSRGHATDPAGQEATIKPGDKLKLTQVEPE